MVRDGALSRETGLVLTECVACCSWDTKQQTVRQEQSTGEQYIVQRSFWQCQRCFSPS